MSKGKIAGIALLGVAAVTGIMGVATATSGSSDTTNTAEQPSGQQSPNAPVPPAPSAPASSSSAAPSSSKPSASNKAAAPTTKVVEAPKPGKPNASAKPGNSANSVNPAAAANGQNPAGSRPGGQDKSASVRVYNNGTVKGLASKAAADIRGKGYTVASVNNYSSGTIPATTVYFRPGTEEEATAKSLASDIGVQAQPRFEGIEKSSPGVIVIVTNDYRA